MTDFAPLNELERLLMAAATDEGARPAFVQAVLNGELFVSPAGDIPPGRPFGPIVISHLETGDAAAAFTSAERLREIVGAEAKVLAVSARTLLNEARSNGVHLNPNLSFGVIWSPADIAAMLDGHRGLVAEASSQILLSHTAEVPQALIQALATKLALAPGVNGAWLMQAHHSGRPEPSWMLGVDTVGEWDDVRLAIGKAVESVDLKGRTLDALNIKGHALGKTLRTGLIVIQPKKRGFFDFLGGLN